MIDRTTGISVSRIPDVPYFELVPDWVCEVGSPSTVALDRSSKMRIYAREGVAHLWLVALLVKTLEVYRFHVAGRVGRTPPPAWLLADAYAGATVVRPEPFDAVEIELARWWVDTA